MFIDLCARAIYYKSMKKIAALVLIVVLGVVLVQGCVDKNDDVKKVADYFRNYSSSGAYTKAEKKLELELGQHFSSYDAASGVFVITEDIELADGETSVTRYGLASESEVYIEPKYGFASVMDIRGDYALVLTSVLENGEEVSYIGVMPFRGAHALKEYPYLNPNYRFRYEYTSPLIQQMTLLDNDYLVVLQCFENGTFKYTEYTAKNVDGSSFTSALGINLGGLEKIADLAYYTDGEGNQVVSNLNLVILYNNFHEANGLRFEPVTFLRYLYEEYGE